MPAIHVCIYPFMGNSARIRAESKSIAGGGDAEVITWTLERPPSRGRESSWQMVVDSGT
jgi:hypothetical protein